MTHSSLRAAFFEQLYHLDVGFVADPRAAHGLPQVKGKRARATELKGVTK
jgi:hypothetical protein